MSILATLAICYLIAAIITANACTLVQLHYYNNVEFWDEVLGLALCWPALIVKLIAEGIGNLRNRGKKKDG